MSKSLYQIRHAMPDDYELVADWHHDHGKHPPPRDILPKCGCIVLEFGEGDPAPVAAMYLYLDNSTGVCFLEHVVTAPGLSLARAREALLVGMRGLREIAAGMDYGIMMCHTLPAIARTLQRENWFVMSRDKVSMICSTRKETDGNRC